MTNIISQPKFNDNGSPYRESENFQNFLFESLDMSDKKEPISFYRSDFRGARFFNNTFILNNFSNSDIIDCYVNSSAFIKCIFKNAELFNSYFEKCNFKNLSFSSSSFVRIIMLDTELETVKYISSNIQKSKYINCRISNCSFAKSTMDEVVFKNTRLENVDLSSMTGMNLFFENCEFSSVTIDADYLGSYFFKENYLDSLKLKYRGRLVNLEIEKLQLLANLFKILFEKKRYYEAINIIVQKNFIAKDNSSIYPIVKHSLNALLVEPNELIRTYQTTKIFELMEYYFNSGYIKLYDYYKLIRFANKIDLSGFDTIEHLDFIANKQRLFNLINLSSINNSMLSENEICGTMFLEITIDETNEKEFERLFEKTVTRCTNTDVAINIMYFIVNKRKGSLIYEIIIYIPLGILLLNSFKKLIANRKTNTEIQELRTQIAASALTKMLSQMNDTQKADDIKKILETAQLASMLDPDVFTNDKTVQQMLSLIKTMQGQPTTFDD